MEKAEHALTVHADALITKEVLNTCIHLVEKGMALVLFLDSENKAFLEENSFLSNKCNEFIHKGGSLFFIPNPAPVKFWKCLADFKALSYYSVEESEVVYKREKDLPYFQEQLLEFEHYKQTGTPFKVEKGDIQIRIKVSEPLVMIGDSVELSWEVDEAEKVIIQGLGKVEAYGRKRIRLEKDTIIKIGASNARHSQIKALLVKVSDENLKIPYDLEFLSAGTKQYRSLIQSDIHPHVYGISQGNQVKLSWQVPVAKEVKILPFGITGTAGEFIFIPSASLTIEIHATMKDRTYIRKIQVLVFPIPVFKEKLISFTNFIPKKHEVSLPVLTEKKEHIFNIEQERYLQLSQSSSSLGLLGEHKTINLKNTNRSVFTLLKEKYFHKKGVLKEITSIQSYYERPTSTSGTDESSL